MTLQLLAGGSGLNTHPGQARRPDIGTGSNENKEDQLDMRVIPTDPRFARARCGQRRYVRAAAGEEDQA